MEQDILYLLGLGAAAGATARDIVKDVLVDETKKVIKAKILPRIYNKLDEDLHFQFTKNTDVVEEFLDLI